MLEHQLGDNLELDTKGAMTHSKCLVTAEQKAAYAALMPQNAILQVAGGLKKRMRRAGDVWSAAAGAVPCGFEDLLDFAGHNLQVI